MGRLSDLDTKVLGPPRGRSYPLWTWLVQAVGTFGLVWGGTRAAVDGFGSATALVPLACGVLGHGVALAWWVRHRHDPS